VPSASREKHPSEVCTTENSQSKRVNFDGFSTPALREAAGKSLKGVKQLLTGEKNHLRGGIHLVCIIKQFSFFPDLFLQVI